MNAVDVDERWRVAVWQAMNKNATAWDGEQNALSEKQCDQSQPNSNYFGKPKK